MTRDHSRLVTWMVALGVALLMTAVPAVGGAPAGGAAETPAAEKPPAGEAGSASAAGDATEEWRAHIVTSERAFRSRDFARAEAELVAAVKVAEAFGKEGNRLAVTLGRLVQVYAMQGEYAEAIGPAKRLLEARETVLGPDHINVADALNNLAGLYMDTDQPKKAKPLLERALTICKGDDRTSERLRAIVLDNLAELHRDQGRLDPAESAAREALALRKEQYGENNRWYAKSLETVGTVLLARGQAAEAEKAFRECLSIRRMKLGWNRPVIIRSLVHLADACKAQKKDEPAENYYKQAIRMGEGGLGRNDDARAEAYEGYADLLRQADRAGEAAEMAEQAKTIRAALGK